MNPDVEKDIQRDADEETRREPPYRVLIHNDDVTPMDFVVAILLRVFNHSLIIAEAIMWEAHSKGIARVATLPKSEAVKKVAQAHFAAQLEGYPLRLTIEPEK